MIDVKLAVDTLVITTDQAIEIVYETLDKWSTHARVFITHVEQVEVIGPGDLTEEEYREHLDMTPGQAEEAWERGELQTDWVRYQGDLIPLSDFSGCRPSTRDIGLPGWMEGWHGFICNSFFVGVLLRYNDHCEGCGPFEVDFTGESGVTLATYIRSR